MRSHKTLFWLAASLVWLAPVDVRAAERSLQELEKDVANILSEEDNVTRRKKIAPVFELASRYAKSGDTNKAIEHFEKALEHQPWRLDAQMISARLLSGIGKTNLAREKAEIVWKSAETDELLAQAAKVLGKPFETSLPETQPWPLQANALALVPVGDVDVWLLRYLRENLEKHLEIPVIIRHEKVGIPEPKRNPLALKAEGLRERILQMHRKQGEFRLLLERHVLSTNNLADDDKVFTMAEALLETEKDKEYVRVFRDEIAFLRRLGPQRDAEELLTNMQTGLQTGPGSRRGYLVVTTMDLFSKENRFVFGLAGGNTGIFSYRRFTAALADGPPDRGRLGERALKQALSSSGLLFGLPRCTDPTCSRSYANSLDEHDAKQIRLCTQCKTQFQARFKE